jgi:hypothetical protein
MKSEKSLQIRGGYAGSVLWELTTEKVKKRSLMRDVNPSLEREASPLVFVDRVKGVDAMTEEPGHVCRSSGRSYTHRGRALVAANHLDRPHRLCKLESLGPGFKVCRRILSSLRKGRWAGLPLDRRHHVEIRMSISGEKTPGDREGSGRNWDKPRLKSSALAPGENCQICLCDDLRWLPEAELNGL